MDLDLVLVDQDLGGVWPERPFLGPPTRLWPAANSASSRLPFMRVLGPLDREAVPMQEPTQLVVAEADAGGLQVGRQARHTPGGEAVAERLRVGLHGLAIWPGTRAWPAPAAPAA